MKMLSAFLKTNCNILFLKSLDDLIKFFIRQTLRIFMSSKKEYQLTG